jgi:hypothetical protein
MMLCLLVTTIAAAKVTKFSDVPRSYWGYETIMRMAEEGIFKGTTEAVGGVAKFSPEDEMTRAEFITASLRATFPEDAAEIGNDSKVWWRKYYYYALENDILIRGELDDGQLDKPMTREEMAMIMVRCVEANGEKLSQRIKWNQIPDYSTIDNYFKYYVRDCYSYGLLCGVDDDGTFDPKVTLTRAEAATVICRLIDKDMRVDIDFKGTSSGGNKDDNTGKPNDNPSYNEPEDEQERLPWENGGKKPSEYTWDEYEALTDYQKSQFKKYFGSEEAFEGWMNWAQGSNEDHQEELPWENGGKQPSEYTLIEFEALTNYQKKAFVESFGSEAAFERWLEAAKGSEGSAEYLPWENGGKQPSEYTLEEFEALTDYQKKAFVDSFGSEAKYKDWLNKAQATQNDSTKLPWENGGKQPSEYTLEEFEALTDYQKKAFVDSFGSEAAFERWLSQAQEPENDDEQLPWENGGKQPSEYTLEEFEALTDYQKKAFVDSFGSEAAFERWYEKALEEEDAEELPWENGGKQPSEYTFEEFERLSEYQKKAFVESFGSEAAFERWLNSVLP